MAGALRSCPQIKIPSPPSGEGIFFTLYGEAPFMEGALLLRGGLFLWRGGIPL